MKQLYLFRLACAIAVGALALVAFWAHFYPVKILDIQFLALIQKTFIDFSVFSFVLLIFLIAATLIFGRIYCSILCPLGLYQEFLMWLFRKRVPFQKNTKTKYFLAAVLYGTLLGGTIVCIRWLDPYSVFGSGISGSITGIILMLVLAVIVWFRGRIFCTRICPVGTVLGYLAKRSVLQIYISNNRCVSCGLCATQCPTGSIDFKNKTVDNETCIKCFKCLGHCHHNSLKYGTKPQQPIAFSPYRRRLLINTAIVAAFALAFKGGMELGKNLTAKIKKVILPPGGGNPQQFANRCLNCNLCVANCPMKIIKKANGDYPAVHLDYQSSFCDYDCHRCSEVCPSGAIKRLTLAEKQKTKIGLAVVDHGKCVQCGLCAMHCPRQIISWQESLYPAIDSEGCIGCGTCQSVCPQQAIHVIPVEQQSLI